MTYTQKFTLCILTLSLIGFSISTQANSIMGAGKTCNFIENGLYLPFSDIDRTFPIFGALTRGVCVDVTNSVDDMVAYGFQVFLGIVILFSVVQVSVAGIQWMTKDTSASASNAKEKLTNSIIGLVLAVSSWLIINTVNSRILTLRFDIVKNPLQAQINKGIQQAAAIGATDPGPAGTIAGTGGVGGDATGTIGAGAGGVGGTVGGNTAPSRFTNQDWADYARQQIEASGLTNLSPSDAARFFPGGQPTTDGYVRLFEEMIARESGFNPNNTFPEPGLGYNSVGLFQLSAVDFNNKYTEEQLKDPYTNLKLGIDRFKTLVEKGGCIACGNTGSASQSGAAAYWSVLREPASSVSGGHENGKRDEIISAVQTQ